MQKIVVYEPSYNAKLRDVLRSFAEGCGAEVRDQTDYVDCDVAVIFGWYKRAYEPTMSKLPIIRKHWGRRLIVIESAFVRRGEYYQVGYGGFAGNADFNTLGRDLPLDRWDKLEIPLQKWRKAKKNSQVVVMGQLPRDTQVQDIDHIKWIQNVMSYYRREGIPAAFRPHPRVDDPGIYGIDYSEFTKGKLPKIFNTARCVVTWNSTSAVDALICGVPAIACDRSSIAWPVAGHDYRDVSLDQLQRPDRLPWLANIGYSQWTTHEMKRGLAWRHLNQKN